MKNILRFVGSTLVLGVIFVSNVNAMDSEFCNNFHGRLVICSTSESLNCSITELAGGREVEVVVEKTASREDVSNRLIAAIQHAAETDPYFECLLTDEYVNDKVDVIYKVLENSL